MESRQDCLFVPITDRRFIPENTQEILSRGIFGPSTVGDLKMARRVYNLIQMGVIPVCFSVQTDAADCKGNYM